MFCLLHGSDHFSFRCPRHVVISWPITFPRALPGQKPSVVTQRRHFTVYHTASAVPGRINRHKVTADGLQKTGVISVRKCGLVLQSSFVEDEQCALRPNGGSMF